MPQANGYVNIEDYNGEKSAVSVNLQDINPAGTNYGSVSQDLDEIKDAVQFFVRGIIRNTKLSVEYPEDESSDVTDVEAVREGKWLVTYRDETPYLGTGNTAQNPGEGKKFTFEIPTPKRSLLTDNEDYLDLNDPAIAPNVAALEANIRSPYNRNVAAGITAQNQILSMRYVGRNN